MQPQSLLSSSPRKFCIVLRSRQDNSDNYEFNFYIVDPHSFPCSGDEYPQVKPTVRFKGSRADSHTVAFCVLNSTLYMFEGDDEPRRKRRAGRFAAKFEIPAGLNNYVIERNDLVTIKPMNETKICPKAVPTPDGKSILVFSSQFFYVEPGCYDDSFELYDVGEGSWRALPRLPSTRPPPGHSHHHRIKAYGFESRSRFVILMDDAKFVLDLQTLQWERDLDFHAAPNCGPSDPFFGIDGLYFTSYAVYDGSDGHGPFWYDGLRSASSHDRSMLNSDIALLGDEYDGAYDIAVVRAEKPPHCGWSRPNNLHVILDTYRIDVVQFKRDFEIYKSDMEEYMGEVQEFLPDVPLLNTTVYKTMEGLRADFYKYKRDMKKYFMKLQSPPHKPSLKTTVSKTLKFQIDFSNHNRTRMYVYPI